MNQMFLENQEQGWKSTNYVIFSSGGEETSKFYSYMHQNSGLLLGHMMSLHQTIFIVVSREYIQSTIFTSTCTQAKVGESPICGAQFNVFTPKHTLTW